MSAEFENLGKCPRVEESVAGNTAEDSRYGGMMTIACVVENRSRETVVAIARNHRCLEIFSLVDTPSYDETTELLSHLAPEEIILHGSACQGLKKSLLCRKIEAWRNNFQGSVEIRPVSRAYFDQDRGAEFLRRVSTVPIDGETLARYTVLGAAFALLKYIEVATAMTFPRGSVQLNFIDSTAGDFLVIDRKTSNSLEILSNARSGDQKNCLFGKIDRTKTVGGARFLRQQLLRPSADTATIRARQAGANYLLDNEDILSGVIEQLKRVPDLDCILNRLVSIQEGKTNARVVGANIKTIISVKHTIAVMRDIVCTLQMHDTGERDMSNDDDTVDPNVPELISVIIANLLPDCTNDILDKITSVLTESTMLSKGTQSMQHEEIFAVAVGMDGMLDVARKTYLQTVEEIYAEAEKLSREYDCSIKVHNTQARGYHLKLPGSLTSLPGDCFIQCVKSAKFIACTTREICSLSDRAHESLQEGLTITDKITLDLLMWIQTYLTDLFAIAESTSMLDMLCSFAELNLTSPRCWCCPSIREDGALVIKQGRHPIMAELSDEHGKVIVESDSVGGMQHAAQDTGRTDGGFIPNDTFLDSSSSLHVVSGVNGSGKTTYIKQVALIVILAQIGCYVPAEDASIPVRSRILSRIGTGDDIENNLSTFLMEMKDAAYICKHKNEKSLVLLDELGRGTANRDGSAIAWSVAETLLSANSNLCLFVSHYPLLLNLATVYPSVKNVHMTIDQAGGKLSGYRHVLAVGSSTLETDYGIDLAERMGIENEVLERARTIKAKIIEAAPPGVDEALTGGDMGRLASTLKLLLRRLSSLKGASIDDRALRTYLDRIKSQLPKDKQLRLLQALQADITSDRAVAYHFG